MTKQSLCEYPIMQGEYIFMKNIHGALCLGFILSAVFCSHYSIALSNKPVVLTPAMRVTAGLHKGLDGKFCAVDPRGRSEFTPYFVQPANRSGSSIPNGVPVCSAKETKAFQKKAGRVYLDKHQVQVRKTAVGAAIGQVLKGLGLGCVIGSASRLLLNMVDSTQAGLKNRQAQREAASEGKSICIDCVLNADNAVFASGGAAAEGWRAVINQNKIPKEALQEIKTLAVEHKVKQIKNVRENPSALKEVILKATDKRDRLLGETEKQRAKELKMRKILDKHAAQGAVRYTQGTNRFTVVRNQSPQIIAETVKADAKAYNSLIKRSIKTSTAFVRAQNVVNFWKSVSNYTLTSVIREHAEGQVSRLNPVEQFRTLPASQKILIVGKYPHLSAFKSVFGGMIAGAAGAVICQDGTAFLLEDSAEKSKKSI